MDVPPPPKLFANVFPETFYVLWCGPCLNQCPLTVYKRHQGWLVFASEQDATFFGDNILEWGPFEVEEVTLKLIHEIFEAPALFVIFDRNWKPGQLHDPRPTFEMQVSYGRPTT